MGRGRGGLSLLFKAWASGSRSWGVWFWGNALILAPGNSLPLCHQMPRLERGDPRHCEQSYQRTHMPSCPSSAGSQQLSELKGSLPPGSETGSSRATDLEDTEALRPGLQE